MQLDQPRNLDILPNIPGEPGYALIGRAVRQYVGEVAYHHNRTLEEGVTDFVMVVTILHADPGEDYLVMLTAEDRIENHLRWVDSHGADDEMGKTLAKPAPSGKFILIIGSLDHGKVILVLPRNMAD